MSTLEVQSIREKRLENKSSKEKILNIHTAEEAKQLLEKWPGMDKISEKIMKPSNSSESHYKVLKYILDGPLEDTGGSMPLVGSPSVWFISKFHLIQKFCGCVYVCVCGAARDRITSGCQMEICESINTCHTWFLLFWCILTGIWTK